MSLLMKALEKAAKDRGETRTEAPVAPAPSKSELTLEPIAASAAAPARPEPAARPGAAPIPSRPGEARAGAQPPRPASSPAAPRPPVPPAPARDQSVAQAQASTVLQAEASSRPAAAGIADYVRARPVLLIGTIAGLFAVGFGVYVYLQIFQPGLLAGQSTVVAKGPLPALKPPPPAPVTPAPAEPLASETVLKEAAAESATATAKPQPVARTPAPEQTAARSNAIVVSSGSVEPAMNPALGQAYAALQAGDSDAAQRLYGELLKSEPRNVDALLGLAAIAGRKGNAEEAVRLYLQILELEPRHALAQSGLIALLGRADPLAAESRLKQLIAREPSSWLYFTLGNVYADQSQWAAAQHAYYQAHHLEPANPDYAYNLAVGLEHVGQPKLALNFYRRAVDLAAARGRANFNLPLTRDRIGKLAQQVE